MFHVKRKRAIFLARGRVGSKISLFFLVQALVAVSGGLAEIVAVPKFDVFHVEQRRLEDGEIS